MLWRRSPVERCTQSRKPAQRIVGRWRRGATLVRLVIEQRRFAASHDTLRPRTLRRALLGRRGIRSRSAFRSSARDLVCLRWPRVGHDRARLLRDTRLTPRDRIRSYASQVYDFVCMCGTRAESGRSLAATTYDFVSDESASGAPHRSRRAATAATPIQFLTSLDSPLPDLVVAHARTILVTVVC